MFATAITIALFGFVLTLVVDIVRRDGRKIASALAGKSWTAQPAAGRPVTVRFSLPRRVAEPARQSVLRAAA